MQVNPYLHLNGTTKEAMKFYKECLGGELTMQTVGESPMKDHPMSKGNEHKIMHSSLKKGDNILLMASDMMDPSTFTPGDTMSVSLDCDSEKHIKDVYKKLSAGGKASMPL